MNVTIEKNELVIRIPLTAPTPTHSGRTLLVASSSGIQETDCVLPGHGAISVKISAHVTPGQSVLAQWFHRDGERTIPLRERQHLTRLARSAARVLWQRTGAGDLSDFLPRHPYLEKCCIIIHGLNKASDGGITSVIAPSHAVALLFLMASSATPRGTTSDGDLDWSRWERAVTFWQHLAGSSQLAGQPDFRQLRRALAPRTGLEAEEAPDGRWNVVDSDSRLLVDGPFELESEALAVLGRSPDTLEERLAVLARAWALFKDHHRIREEDLVLSYAPNGRLAECVNFGGVDITDVVTEEVSICN